MWQAAGLIFPKLYLIEKETEAWERWLHLPRTSVEGSWRLQVQEFLTQDL